MSLEIKATLKTPKVLVNFEEGIILLAGISIPEDPYAFYNPVIEEIEAYLLAPKENTRLEFKLEYFNTSSTLVIRNLIRDISQQITNTKLKIYWYYEEYDDDMKEAGEEFRLLFKDLDFDLVEVAEFE
ncbi:MAG: DUF1987 domain-containing protein [Crocinitomicaceae bacterium]|jgi:hypothetical protein|nr:DUF1987 domain-containing protein [Crocinitomicaceae bacterium]